MVLFYVMLNFTLQNSVNVTCVILCYAELHPKTVLM